VNLKYLKSNFDLHLHNPSREVNRLKATLDKTFAKLFLAQKIPDKALEHLTKGVSQDCFLILKICVDLWGFKKIWTWSSLGSYELLRDGNNLLGEIKQALGSQSFLWKGNYYFMSPIAYHLIRLWKFGLNTLWGTCRISWIWSWNFWMMWMRLWRSRLQILLIKSEVNLFWLYSLLG
jgi:hypothetical protein